jgi:hypothetical protein
VQTTGFVPTQEPAWHASVWVHAFPSSQVVPSVTFEGAEHAPVALLQVPAVWQEFGAVQTTGFEPTQVPDMQVSV